MFENLRSKVGELVSAQFGLDLEVVLTRPEAKFGDFSTNVALQLAGKLENPPAGGPRAIAESICEQLVGGDILSAEVAGPGFINIKLTDAALIELTKASAVKTYSGQKVLVEYSDPNPFKPLHAGHLYTTLVGDVIARMVEYAGAEVVRLNFGGDVGLHAAKSMWAIMRWLDGQPAKLDEVDGSERPKWLGERYVEGNNAYEDDESAKSEIIFINKKIYSLYENGAALSSHIVEHSNSTSTMVVNIDQFRAIYDTCREWSYEYFKELYKQLEVSAFDRFIPESEVTPLGLTTVKEQLAKGVYAQSGGAVIFEGEKFGLHNRVFINSEGLPTYEAKDVGLSLTKWQDYHFDKSIIITANEQAQYMQVVIKSIEQFAPEPASRTLHLTHGVVKLQGGVKMSSRKGNIVTANDILQSARQASPEADESTVLAAVKYAFSKSRIGGDIVYDPLESVATEGNSGPYLQYAHARARSILSKLTINYQLSTINPVFQPGERLLVRKIGEFSEVVELSVRELMPHYICTYLYELAQEFNRFYEQNRVIDSDDREELRLWLVGRYADTLKAGLDLLGIHAPEKM
jgi:arginyl-tRNA synthetase